MPTIDAPHHSSEFREGAEAHYRDGTYYDRRYCRRLSDVRHYVELARRHGGPVLELGVGTARVARRVAEAGFEVVGVDGMQSMLTQARARLSRANRAVRARVMLQPGDIRELSLQRRFPLIIAPFNVFMHLYTRRDVERTLASVRRHLAAGGRFAFDVSNPDPRALSRNPTRVYRCRPVVHPHNGLQYEYGEAFHYDRRTQVMHVSMIMERDEGNDVQITALSQRQFFPVELEALLHYNGFSVQRLEGGFSGEHLSSHSESIVIVASARDDLDCGPQAR